MRISTKGLYAIRMLLDLAEHQNCGNIALKDIADRQQISKKYLEQIIPVLNNAGVLRTVRGSLGGYQLAGTPDKFLPVWQGLNKVITDYLDSITLQDILDRSRELAANDYVI